MWDSRYLLQCAEQSNPELHCLRRQSVYWLTSCSEATPETQQSLICHCRHKQPLCQVLKWKTDLFQDLKSMLIIIKHKARPGRLMPAQTQRHIQCRNSTHSYETPCADGGKGRRGKANLKRCLVQSPARVAQPRRASAPTIKPFSQTMGTTYHVSGETTKMPGTISHAMLVHNQTSHFLQPPSAASPLASSITRCDGFALQQKTRPGCKTASACYAPGKGDISLTPKKQQMKEDFLLHQHFCPVLWWGASVIVSVPFPVRWQVHSPKRRCVFLAGKRMALEAKSGLWEV